MAQSGSSWLPSSWINMNAMVLAVLGYLFSYWHTKKSDERKANIERINEQLRELYGPLLACITATKSAYKAMVKSATSHLGAGASAACLFKEAITTDPQGPVSASYRRWMEHVLQPLNEQAADIIVKRIDLLESDAISAHLLNFVAHVAANRVVLQQWRQGDLNAHSAIPFPDEIADFIVRHFAMMKRKQARLLGIRLQSKL